MNNKKMLLFCFPYAGGTADFFNELEAACGNRIEFIKFEYSGHGTRMKEPLYSSFTEVTNDFIPQIKRILDNNQDAEYSMSGYSMGSIALFDVIKEILNRDDIQKPNRVFISAHQPKSIYSLKTIPEVDLDDWVKKRTIDFGGVDEKLLNNNIFWRVYLPIFKADYQMIANYNFDKINVESDIPATVFYSEEDTPFEEMKEWERFFVKECNFVKYNGTHFFIKEYYNDMARIILDSLKD
jgi:surfactin synthase thioesterase subunit